MRSRDDIRTTDDDGFSLIEIVVALSVLMVLALAVSITLINGLNVSKQSRQRVAASNLAAREVEIVRNTFGSSETAALAVAALGAVDNANPLGGAGPSLVDGTPYTVRRDVQWMATGNGVSACDGGSLVSHPSLKVSVSVTWPDMRTTKPVRTSTLLTPPKGSLGSTTIAFVAAKIQNASGLPASGVTVKATGPGGSFSHVTDASGCAVFQVGAAGTYNVFMDMPGWVNQLGVQLSAKSQPVSAGQLARLSMTYDRAASMEVFVVTDAGYSLPSPLPAVNYTKPNVDAALARQQLASSPTGTSVTGLWPTLDGYAAWAGSCADSDPAGAPTSGSRGDPVVIAAGDTAAVDARLAPVDLTVTDGATGLPLATTLVTAVSQSTCSGSDGSLTLGSTDAAGQLKASLPFGTWLLSAGGRADIAPMSPSGTGPTTYTMAVAP